MKSLRMLILLAACGAASTSNISWAAEQPAPAKPATPASSPAPPKPADESAAPKTDEDSKDEAKNQAKDPPKDPVSDEAADKPKPAATTADKKGSSPQRFVPSEQVRADFDVSFPIDI